MRVNGGGQVWSGEVTGQPVGLLQGKQGKGLQADTGEEQGQGGGVQQGGAEAREHDPLDCGGAQVVLQGI